MFRGSAMYERLPLRYVVLTAISFLLVHTPTTAREIYRWVDEGGATHYGEVVPEGDVASLEVLEVTVMEVPPEAALRDYRATLDLANRMQADRLERERLRLEREKLRLQQRQVELDDWNSEDVPPSTSYYVPYYRYPRRPYPRPPYYGKYPGYPRPPHGQHPPGRYPTTDAPKRVYLDRP